MTRWRRSALCLTAATVALVAGIYWIQSQTSAVLELPYELAEGQVCSALSLDRNRLITRRFATSHAHGELLDVLLATAHTQRLVEHVPGARLHFRGGAEFNILATGGEHFEIDVEKISPTRTRITVDYAEDTRLLGLLPMNYYPRKWQERRLLKAILR